MKCKWVASGGVIILCNRIRFDAKLIKYNRNIVRNVTCQVEPARAAQVRLRSTCSWRAFGDGCCIAFNYNADIDIIGS